MNRHTQPVARLPILVSAETGGMAVRTLRSLALVLAFCSISLSSNAEFFGALPATSGGTDWQAYYDDQLDITWTANADINGFTSWSNHVDWAAGLEINGVDGWRLASMDVDGDGTVTNCVTVGTVQAACADSEFGHLFFYGAGTTMGSGVTSASPSPFSNLMDGSYFSGTEDGASRAWVFRFTNGGFSAIGKGQVSVAWAVHDGDVGTVPEPAHALLLVTGALVLMGARSRRAT